MRWRLVCAVGAAVGLLIASATWPAPPMIAPEHARDHLGDFVTVEGDVVATRTENDTYVLEFAPRDDRGFRAVLVLGLLASPPPPCAGRRVQVSGLVRSFAGRPEIVLRDPAQLRLVGAEPAETHAASAPEPPGAQRSDSPPARPAEPAPARGVERGLVGAVEQRIARWRPCEEARTRWRATARDARERARAFGDCAGGESYRCGEAASALGHALAALEAIEREVEASCP